jgi:hypothetical protein
MTKKELWRQYVAKNPSFEGDDNITMSAAGLRKLFNQTWDMAFECGEEDEDEDVYKKQSVKSVPTSNLGINELKQIFGMS